MTRPTKPPRALGARAVPAVCVAVCLVACESRQAPADDPPETTAAPAAEETPPPLDVEPPPDRLAYPIPVLAVRLESNRVGTLYDASSPEGEPLLGVGFNVCQTGWMVQGLTPSDEPKTIEATPPFQLAIAEIPTGETVRYVDPQIEGKHLELEFERADMDWMTGEFRVVSRDADEPLMRMKIDGKPNTIATAAGVGAQGCYTTGYYRIDDGSHTVAGPVSAVYDGRGLFWVGLRLTTRHTLSIWLVMKPQHIRPDNVVVGSLRRVAEAPEKFPIRVVMETKTNSEPVGQKTGPVLTRKETPVKSGRVKASFANRQPKGPLRVELEDLRIPEWDGPLAGRTIERVRVETMIVTEPERPSVPVPSRPAWLDE